MTSQSVAQAFLRMCETFDTARSLTCSLLFVNGEFEQLAKLDLRPLDYLESDVEKFRDDYLLTEYLSKYKGLETRIDTARVAFDSFTAAEESCARTNERIHQALLGNEIPAWILDVLSRAQVKIQQCLGDRVRWRDALDCFRWGPGATYSLKGVEARLDNKLLEEQISVTAEALPLLRAAMSTDYAWLRARGIEASGPTFLVDSEFRIVKGARALAVSKNAKTDRIINAEPSGNIFLQLGFGGLLRRCLRRVGIDLNDQTINQGLAKTALVNGLATVDLKAASDTISSAVVWLLLPYAWASTLDRLRSPMCRVQGKWLPLRKFSAMGNGYTFELETLIFWALTEGLRDHLGATGRVSVYGDDIICPVGVVPSLRELFSFLGFETNVKKTHWEGVFRESCGKHFFNGLDVTPIYQKEVLNDASEVFRFYNRLLYHALDRGSFAGTTGVADSKFRWLSAIRSTTSGEVAAFFARLNLARSRKGRRTVDINTEHLQIPIVSSQALRTLDGGFLTDVRSLVYRYVPGSVVPYRTLCWVFNPIEQEASHDAIFAARFRSVSPARDLPIVPAFQARHGFLRNRVVREVLGYENKPLPFKGTVAARRQGRFVLKRTKHPEGCELRWS